MKLFIVFLLSPFIGFLHAQTFDEIFNQDATQRKYLLQQIAALKGYASFMNKGYSIAKDGLGSIGGIKNDEMGLHKDYFNSLDNISLTVSNYPKVKGIQDFQQRILQQHDAIKTNIKTNKWLNAGEIKYVNSVLDNLMVICGNDMDKLIALTTPGKLQLTEDERLQGINTIYGDMADKYQFIQNYATQIKVLSVQRMKEDVETKNSKSYF